MIFVCLPSQIMENKEELRHTYRIRYILTFVKKQFTCLFHSQFVSQLFGWCVCMCVRAREWVLGPAIHRSLLRERARRGLQGELCCQPWCVWMWGCAFYASCTSTCPSVCILHCLCLAACFILPRKVVLKASPYLHTSTYLFYFQFTSIVLLPLPPLLLFSPQSVSVSLPAFPSHIQTANKDLRVYCVPIRILLCIHAHTQSSLYECAGAGLKLRQPKNEILSKNWNCLFLFQK